MQGKTPNSYAEKLKATEKNLVAYASGLPWFVHPLLSLVYYTVIQNFLSFGVYIPWQRFYVHIPWQRFYVYIPWQRFYVYIPWQRFYVYTLWQHHFIIHLKACSMGE
jgi:hypothetical protein